MIPVLELSIGNYVICKSRLTEVRSINSDYVFVDWPENTDLLFQTRAKYLEPVILNVHVIEELGFEKKSEFGISWYERRIENFTLELSIQKSNSVNYEWYFHIDNKDHDTIAGADVSGLHQIQNILSIYRIPIDPEKEFLKKGLTDD